MRQNFSLNYLGEPMYLEDRLAEVNGRHPRFEIPFNGLSLVVCFGLVYDPEGDRLVEDTTHPFSIGHQPSMLKAGNKEFPIHERLAWNISRRGSPRWSVYTFPHRDGWEGRRDPWRKEGFSEFGSALAWRIGGGHDTVAAITKIVGGLEQDARATMLIKGRRIVAEFEAEEKAATESEWGKLLHRANINPMTATKNEIRIAKIATGEEGAE